MATQIVKGTQKAAEVSLPDLAKLAINVHGGLERWKQFKFLTARLVQGGVLWGLKGKAGVLEYASVKVDLRREWATHRPFALTDYRSSFTPQRVAIETRDGQVIEQLLNPRESFWGYEMETPWSNPRLRTSLVTQCGRISRRPSFSPSLAWSLKRSNHGMKMGKHGADSEYVFRTASPRTARSRPFILIDKA